MDMAKWPLGLQFAVCIAFLHRQYVSCINIFLCRQKDNNNWSKSAEQSFIVCNAQNVICQSGQSHVDHSVYRFINFSLHIFILWFHHESSEFGHLLCLLATQHQHTLAICFGLYQSISFEMCAVIVSSLSVPTFVLFFFCLFELAAAANCIDSN